MIIEEISSKKYIEIVKECPYIYCSSEFNELNKYKVDEIKYLLFHNTKNRFVLCAGVLDRELHAPFSAPFSMFIDIKKDTDVLYYKDAVEALMNYAYIQKLRSIQITFPPLFYSTRSISLFTNSLHNSGFKLSQFDLNFHLDLKKMHVDNYANLLPRNGRKNLRIALSSALEFIRCHTSEEITEAYRIIKDNRDFKGKPLRMSLEQMMATLSIVPHEIFIVRSGIIDIAAAFVFHLNAEIAQVIYWGDRPGHSESKPINFLAYRLIQFYGECNFNVLDIGISTEKSVVNNGLCDFKESIGCKTSPKLTLTRFIEGNENG